jgi:hypothetical protein
MPSRTPADRPPAASLKRITVLIDEDNHTRLKALCATHRIMLIDATREALEAYIKVLEKRKTPMEKQAAPPKR